MNPFTPRIRHREPGLPGIFPHERQNVAEAGSRWRIPGACSRFGCIAWFHKKPCDFLVVLCVVLLCVHQKKRQVNSRYEVYVTSM